MVGPCAGQAERVASRRRGAALEDAILQAAYEELSESGYTAFSVESVAARARTGKASIYRRWTTKAELVMDALCAALPEADEAGLVPQLPDSVSTADALRGMAEAITAVLASPAGDAMRAVKCEAATDPSLARLIDDRFQAPRRRAMLALLRRGVERGEVRPDAATPLVADVLPAVLSHRVILQREPITKRTITDIIDQVLLPLIEVR
ncbi:MAG TPA: TetR-like C-terminal domain-containing protein [Jatrophihabitans sp.]|nr:TetR-like C-terminal domain-containing protein [Jatrophihabitans sp.]